MEGWVSDLWVFGVSVGLDPARHWIYLVQGIQGPTSFDGRLVGWRQVESPGSAMAIVANSMSIKTNDLDHGPIQCYMTNGLEPDSLILQVQTI